MANKFKGEVPLAVDGKEYIVRFSANALAELEDSLDMGINAIMAQLANVETMRMKTVIKIVYAGLRDRQPDVTLAQAGEIITDASIVRTMEALNAALVLAFGEKTENDPTPPSRLKNNAGGSVTTRTAGTGSIS